MRKLLDRLLLFPSEIHILSKALVLSDLKITEAYLASFDEEAVDSTIDDVFS